MILKKLKNSLIQAGLSAEEIRRVDQAMKHTNSVGFDHWGVNPETLKASLSASSWLYRHYFRVAVNHVERVPEGRCLIIANHGGQIPLDGMLIATSLMLEANPPRLARGMVERWAPGLPFVSTFFSRNGQVTGDIRNCRDLLENEECVMVFPEGVGGSGKTIFHRYELQRFGTGFVRLALETKCPIVPVAVIGCEETLPSFSGLPWLSKKIGIPYIPVVPTGLVPLPTRVTIRYGEPLRFDGDPEMPDRDVEKLVEKVKDSIRFEIDAGLRARGEKIFTASAVDPAPGKGEEGDGHGGR